MADQRTTPRRDHVAVAKEAGLGRVSLLSVLAGTLTSYGAFAVVAAIVGATLAALDVDTDFSTNDWATTGTTGIVVTAVALFLAYLAGGYVAGRMARRSGVLHGLAVAVLSLAIGALAGVVVAGLADAEDVERNLRSIGVPTTGDAWGEVGLAAAIAAVAAMALGGLLGGGLGERWHTTLARRAADPTLGPAADARRRAEDAEAARDHQLLARDDLVGRDATLAGAGVAGATTGPDRTSDRTPDRAGDDATIRLGERTTSRVGERTTGRADEPVGLREDRPAGGAPAPEAAATDDTTALGADDRERARQASLDDAARSTRRP